MPLYFLIPIGLLGFCAHEAALRIVDPTDGLIKRVGVIRYLAYFFSYGAFSSFLGGAAASLANDVPWQILIAASGGFSIPAGGRTAMTVMVRLFWSAVENFSKSTSSMEQRSTKVAPPARRRSRRGSMPRLAGDGDKLEETWVSEGEPLLRRMPGWLRRFALVARLPGLH